MFIPNSLAVIAVTVLTLLSGALPLSPVSMIISAHVGLFTGVALRLGRLAVFRRALLF